MSDHLRLMPDQYAALCQACHPLSLVGSYSAFQRRLVAALRPHDASLAGFVAKLGARRVRTLRRHFEELRAETELPGYGSREQAGCRLTFHEWRAVTEAFALVRLRDGSLDAFHGCLAEVSQEQPALAEKLQRLAAGQVAMLYMRVKAGRRCG